MNDDKRLDTFGGADDLRPSPRANVALTAEQWGAVCVAVHHGFEAVLRRKDVPMVAQSAFSKDIEAAMAQITSALKAHGAVEKPLKPS